MTLPIHCVDQNDLMDWENHQLSLVFTTEATNISNLTGLAIGFCIFMCFLKHLVHRHTVCTRINYTIFPLTNLNKYLHYCISRTEYMYINTDANNGSEKL